MPLTLSLTLPRLLSLAVACSALSACTLDDGQLTQTVPLDQLQGESNERECRVRIQNLAGDVRIEARGPQSEAPEVAQIPAFQAENSGPSDAVIHWVGETDAEGIAVAPRMFVDDSGVLVIEDGCDALAGADVICQASIDAWIPATCSLEVRLGVGRESSVVGFEGTLDLTAEEANTLVIDHNGDARIGAERIHDAVFFCGEGSFEFDVGGDVIACDGTT